MLFVIKYQTKKDAADPHSHFTQSIYAESDARPTKDKVLDLVRRVTGGNFAPETVVVEECEVGSDPEELKRFKEQNLVHDLTDAPPHYFQ